LAKSRHSTFFVSASASENKTRLDRSGSEQTYSGIPVTQPHTGQNQVVVLVRLGLNGKPLLVGVKSMPLSKGCAIGNAVITENNMSV
jgi:hypothetical protein